MRRLFIACALLLGLAGPAVADFSVGQDRFASGDYDGAYAAWLPLAEEGDPRAQYSLGLMHRQGLGRAKDPDGAADWFERAAKQGFAPAAAALKALNRRVAAATAPPATEAERVERALRGLIVHPTGTVELGPIKVAAAGDGHTFVIEGVASNDGDGSFFRAPQVSGRATRIAQDVLRLDFAMPLQIEGRDDKGQPVTVSTGDGVNTAVWNETLETATSGRFETRGMSIVGAGQSARFARTLALLDFTPAANQRWGGPVEVRFEGMSFEESQGGRGKIDLLSFRMDFAGMDLRRWAELSRGEGKNLLDSPAELRTLLSGAAIEVAVEGLEGTGPQGRFGLRELRTRLALSKLDTPAFDLEIGYRHDGVVSAIPSENDALAPREAEIKLTLTRAPMEALVQSGFAAVIEYMLLGQLNSGPALLEKLRQGFAEAGTQLRIDNGLYRAEKARVTAAGAFAADGGAAFGVVGALGVAVAGMDELVKAAAEQGDQSMMLKLSGRGERSPDGKTLTYRFELGRDGQALLNGRPVAELFAE